MSDIPADILETVSRMKRWLAATVCAVSGADIDSAEAAAIADIVLAYVDGETLNLINERVVPGEDVHGRIVDNALRVYRLLILDATAAKPSRHPPAPGRPYPKLRLADDPRGA
jgi:hypothetical protein